MAKKVQSVEPNVADLANGWLKSYKLPYKLEQESLNTEIDQALNDYASKNGGSGGNRPDAKLLLQDKNLVNYPILIEYKGYKDKLVLLDIDGRVANKTAKNQPDFKAINSYAVNEATITTINISKISKFILYIGKENNVFTELSADGVIIATPTGSTAHSFSAGGPIVTSDVNCFIITPICPFTLNQRSYVVNSKKDVTVEVLNEGQFVDIDGRINFDLSIGDRIVVKELKKKTKYVIFESDSFFTNIRNKIKAL